MSMIVHYIVEKYCPVENRILRLRKAQLTHDDMDSSLPIRITIEGRDVILKDTFTLREEALQVLQKPPTTGLC